MAGDWIKMREDLHEDPAVLWMAQQLDARPELVVGFCHKFWGLVSRQTGDGCLTGPTLLSLGQVLGLPGFPELLVEAGWLEHDDSDPGRPVTRIPKFERHLSESAKRRVLTAEKKRLQRQEKAAKRVPKKQGQVSRQNGDQRREEKSKSKKDPCSPLKGTVVYSPAFNLFWETYPEQRRQGKKVAWRNYQAAVRQVAADRSCSLVEAVAYLQDRVTTFAASPLGQCEFCPGPSPWLNQARWEDAPEVWDRQSDQPPGVF